MLADQILDHLVAHVAGDVGEVLASMISRRWAKIALRWSFITSSNFRRFLRMSKLRASTLPCAFSSALFTQGWTIASPSFMPSRPSIESSRSEPKIRIRSSSRQR